MSQKDCKNILVVCDGYKLNHYKDTEDFKYYLLYTNDDDNKHIPLSLGIRYDGIILDTFNINEVLLNRCISRIRPTLKPFAIEVV